MLSGVQNSTGNFEEQLEEYIKKVEADVLINQKVQAYMVSKGLDQGLDLSQVSQVATDLDTLTSQLQTFVVAYQTTETTQQNQIDNIDQNYVSSDSLQAALTAGYYTKPQVDALVAAAGTGGGGSGLDPLLYPLKSEFPDMFDFSKAATTDQVASSLQTYTTTVLPAYIDLQMDNYVGSASMLTQMDTYYYRKAQVDAAIALAQSGGVDMTLYPLKSDFPDLFNFSKAATTDQVSDSLQTYTSSVLPGFLTNYLDNYYATQFQAAVNLEIDARLVGYALQSYVDTQDAALQVQIDDLLGRTTLLETNMLQTADLVNYVQRSEFPDFYNFMKAATTDDISAALQNFQTYVLGGYVEGLVDQKLVLAIQNDMPTVINDVISQDYYNKTQTEALVGAEITAFASVGLPPIIANDYYNKQEVDTKIASVVSGGSINLSNYYTIAQTDTAIAAAITAAGSGGSTVDLTPYYTSAQVDQLLTDYQTKAQTVLDIYNKTEVDNLFNSIPMQFLAPYQTAAQADAKYYLKSEVDALIANVQTGGGGTGGLTQEQMVNYLTTQLYATQPWVTQQGYLKQSALDTRLATEAYINATYLTTNNYWKNTDVSSYVQNYAYSKAYIDNFFTTNGMVSQVDYDAHLANYATLSGRVATAESSLATLNATYNSYLDKWDSIGIRGANTPAIKTLWSLAEDNRDEIAAHLLRIQTLEQSGSTLEADLQAWVQANYGENNTWVTQNKTYLTALPQTLNQMQNDINTTLAGYATKTYVDTNFYTNLQVDNLLLPLQQSATAYNDFATGYQTDVVGLIPRVTSLETWKTATSTQINTLAGDVTQVKADQTTINNNFANINTDIATINNTSIPALQTQITTLNGQMTNKDLQIGNLTTRMNTVETNAVALESRVAINETQILANYDAMALAQQTLDDLTTEVANNKTDAETRLAQLESQVSQLLIRLATYENNMTTLSATNLLANQLNSAVGYLQTDMTNAQTAISSQSDINQLQGVAIANNSNAISALQAGSWDEARITQLEQTVVGKGIELTQTRIMLHHIQVLCQRPIKEYQMFQGTRRQVGVTDYDVGDYGFGLINHYNLTSTSAIQDGIGIQQAYFLQSTDIDIVNHSWSVAEGDQRLSGNPQLKIDLTALRDKINSTAQYELYQIFGSQTVKTNAQYFEWSIEVLSSTNQLAAGGSVWCTQFHVASTSPLTQVYSTTDIWTVAESEQSKIWLNQSRNVSNQWINGNTRTTCEIFTTTGRLDLQANPIMYLALGRNIKDNQTRTLKDYDNTQIRICLHPKGTFGQVV